MPQNGHPQPVMPKPLVCYYAHSMHLYGTLQETRDLELLTQMRYQIIDPNDPNVKEQFEAWKKANPHINPMTFFEETVRGCDVVAFRAYVDGKIGSGVGAEIKAAQRANIPVFEIPSFPSNRWLSLEDTLEYLRLHGQR